MIHDEESDTQDTNMANLGQNALEALGAELEVVPETQPQPEAMNV